MKYEHFEKKCPKVKKHIFPTLRLPSIILLLEFKLYDLKGRKLKSSMIALSMFGLFILG